MDIGFGIGLVLVFLGILIFSSTIYLFSEEEYTTINSVIICPEGKESLLLRCSKVFNIEYHKISLWDEMNGVKRESDKTETIYLPQRKSNYFTDEFVDMSKINYLY